MSRTLWVAVFIVLIAVDQGMPWPDALLVGGFILAVARAVKLRREHQAAMAHRLELESYLAPPDDYD